MICEIVGKNKENSITQNDRKWKEQTKKNFETSHTKLISQNFLNIKIEYTSYYLYKHLQKY